MIPADSRPATDGQPGDTHKTAATDDYVGHVAPLSWRIPRFRLSMAWSALATGMFWLITGCATTFAVGAVPALIGMALAAVVFSAVAGLFSKRATDTGTSIAVMSRSVFGNVGEVVVAFLLAATGVYFAAFEASAVAIASRAYFGVFPLEVWYLIVVTSSILLGIGGLRTWLDKFNGALLPLYVTGIAGALICATAKYGYSANWISAEGVAEVSGPRWLFALSVYLGQAVVLLFAWDYARLARPRDKNFNAKVTFGMPFWTFTFIINGLIGIYLVETIDLDSSLSETSVLLALISLMGVGGLIFIWVTQTRINTANYYVGSSNLKVFLDTVLDRDIRRPITVVSMGLIVYLLTLTDVFSFLLDALRYQGAILGTWIAVFVVCLLPGRRVEAEHPENIASPWPATALSAWLSGSVAAVLILILAPAFGDTWALPIGIAVSGSATIAGRLISCSRLERKTL